MRCYKQPMEQDLFATLAGLTDDDLLVRVEGLAARKHETAALLVAHLVELENRGIHLRDGFGSMFVYGRDGLALAEHDAYNFMEAAKVARRFPVVVDMLATGALSLPALKILGPHLTSANHVAVLESARGKKRAQLEELAARLVPLPDVPPTIRKLPDRPAPPGSPGPEWRPPPFSPRPMAPVVPLSPDRYKVQLTISGETLEKLRCARDLLRHAIPTGDDAAVVARALSALLEDLARQKFGATDKPRPSRGTAPDSRDIPAAVKRGVFVRDLGRCAFVGRTGRRCDERAFLEFHHVKPYMAGGEATLENIELRCRQHNAYESKVFFEDGR
jgi:hypothetical protein